MRHRPLLTPTERWALAALLRALGGTSGRVVLTRIAAEQPVSRRSLQRALTIAEAAGLLEHWNLGRKGTYVCVSDRTWVEGFKEALL